MNKDQILIQVKDLTKIYELNHQASNGRDFVALSNISFELKRNQTIGLIGKNGSGKSTLLKILAGYVKPTSGKVVINGKVNSLIEVGGNFIPDLTGRENVKMFLKFNHSDNVVVDKLVQAIHEFSELGEYYDLPVKYYSSGMFVRLAVSAGFHIDADIFLIDEILMAGDASFKDKVLHHFVKLKKKGAGIIMASHNPSEISLNCEKALWFKKGKLQKEGDVVDVIESYYDCINIENLNFKNLELNILSDSFEFISELDVKLLENKYVKINDFRIKPIDNEVSYEKGFMIELVFDKKSNSFSYHPIFNIYDASMNHVLSILTRSNNVMYKWNCSKECDIGEIVLNCRFPSGVLTEGAYYLELAIGANTDDRTGYSKELFKLSSKLFFKINSVFEKSLSNNASVVPQCEWSYNFK